MSNKNLSLTEATIKALYDDLPDDENVEGVIDDILVITDPEITSDEYDEVIEKAQEIVQDTPEGRVPFDKDYIGQYVQTCPRCGSTFVEKDLFQSGDTCPICLETPDGFVMKGKIESEEDAIEDTKTEIIDNTETQNDIEETDTEKEETDTEKEELNASEEVKVSNNKLVENKLTEDHQLYYDDIQNMNKDERIALWMTEHDKAYESEDEFWDWVEEEFPMKELNESDSLDDNYNRAYDIYTKTYFLYTDKMLEFNEWKSSLSDKAKDLIELGEIFEPFNLKESYDKDTKILSEEETSYQEIVDMMMNAEDYNDLYVACELITDEDLKAEVSSLIADSEEDEDEVSVAASIITTDLLDNKIEEDILKENYDILLTDRIFQDLKEMEDFIEDNNFDILDINQKNEEITITDITQSDGIKEVYKYEEQPDSTFKIIKKIREI